MHRLKYFKEIESYGHLWRVEILQDTEQELTPIEIGPVLQSLRLQVQGDQADIDTAIVKTSLELTFVDAPDLEAERKCGYWEEFYTSSSTEYMIALYKDGEREWTGYVTPDSFEEDLTYRGSVTIIARDNLGHLQDFTFDAPGKDGLISLHDIVEAASKVVNFSMSIYDDISLHHVWPYSADDVDQRYLYTAAQFSTAALAEKNWWEALEDSLHSCGVVLRYIGKNKYVVTPIRNVGLGGRDWWPNVPRKEAAFISYARRSLSPAAKKIVDEVSFEIEDNIGYYILNKDDYGEASSYQFMPVPHLDQSEIISMPIHPVIGGGWDARNANNSLFLNANAFEAKLEHRFGKGGDIRDFRNVYLASNIVYSDRNNRTASFSQLVKPGKYQIKYHVFGIAALYDNNTAIGYINTAAFIDSYKLLIQFFGDDGSVWSFKHKYGTYEYEWVEEDITEGISIGKPGEHTGESPEFDISVEGRLVCSFSNISIIDNAANKQSQGMYLGINNIELNIIDNNDKPVMEHLKIVTEYNDNNNITITRSPKFAANPSEIVSFRVVRNGIYVEDQYGWPIGSEKWAWYKGSALQPLSVLIHQELLAYYARPMDVLSGTLIDKDENDLRFDCLYNWQGKEFVLQSGTLNILTAQMEGAVLRELVRYDRLWETWTRDEDIEIDYVANDSVVIKTHSNKAITKADVTDLPGWLSVRFVVKNEGAYDVVIKASANITGEPREAYFKIDTALVKIAQRAAGDYSADYSKDYS